MHKLSIIIMCLNMLSHYYIYILQNDLNSINEWSSDNNMFFIAQKFQYICFNP